MQLSLHSSHENRYSFQDFINNIGNGALQKKILICAFSLLFLQGTILTFTSESVNLISFQIYGSYAWKTSPFSFFIGLLASFCINTLVIQSPKSKNILLYSLGAQFLSLPILSLGMFFRRIVIASWMLIHLSQFITGISLGIILQLTLKTMTQLVPYSINKKSINLGWVAWSFGLFLGICIYIPRLFRVSLWYINYLFILMIYVVVAIVVKKMMIQDPIALILKEDLSQARKILDMMSMMNRIQKIDDEQFLLLTNSIIQKQRLRSNYRQLFTSQNKKRTFAILFLWFISNFLYYGTIIYIPMLTININLSILCSSIVLFFNIGLLWLAKSLINNSKLGRKKLIIIVFSTLLAAIPLFIILSIFLLYEAVIILMFALSIIPGIIFIALYPYTLQLFAQKHRKSILQMSQIVGKMGCLLLSIFAFPFNSLLKVLVMFLLILLMLIGGIVFTKMLPSDNLGGDIDILFL